MSAPVVYVSKTFIGISTQQLSILAQKPNDLDEIRLTTARSISLVAATISQVRGMRDRFRRLPRPHKRRDACKGCETYRCAC